MVVIVVVHSQKTCGIRALDSSVFTAALYEADKQGHTYDQARHCQVYVGPTGLYQIEPVLMSVPDRVIAHEMIRYSCLIFFFPARLVARHCIEVN